MSKTSKNIFPTKSNFAECKWEDYTLLSLKDISRAYKLKTSMKKELLIKNIILFFRKELSAIKIQSIVRRWFVFEWIKSHGSRNRCVNETDFLTLDPIQTIPFKHFFSIEEKTCDFKHNYGFDIVSMNMLIKNKNTINPYTRKKFESNDIKRFNKMERLSKILNVIIVIDIKEDVKSFDLRCLDLFQKINELGHYSNHMWFLELQKRHLIKFIRDLYDIWFYRCQLTNEIHRNISPRGNPFRYINIYILQDETEEELKRKILNVMEEMIYYGINADSKNLGAYYILGALTITSRNAANALPWLFETFL